MAYFQSTTSDDSPSIISLAIPFIRCTHKPSQTLCLSLSPVVLCQGKHSGGLALSDGTTLSPVNLSDKDSNPFDYTVEALVPEGFLESTAPVTWRNHTTNETLLTTPPHLSPWTVALLRSHVVIRVHDPAAPLVVDIMAGTTLLTFEIAWLRSAPSPPFAFYPPSTQRRAFEEHVRPLLPTLLPSEYLDQDTDRWDAWAEAYRPLLVGGRVVDVYQHLTDTLESPDKEALYLLSLLTLRALTMHDYPVLTASLDGDLVTILGPEVEEIPTRAPIKETLDPSTAWASAPHLLPPAAVVHDLVRRWATAPLSTDTPLTLGGHDLVSWRRPVLLDRPLSLITTWQGRLPAALVGGLDTVRLLSMAITSPGPMEASPMDATAVWSLWRFTPVMAAVVPHWETVDADLYRHILRRPPRDAVPLPPWDSGSLSEAWWTARGLDPRGAGDVESAARAGATREPWMERHGRVPSGVAPVVLWFDGRVHVAIPIEVDLEAAPLPGPVGVSTFEEDWRRPRVEVRGGPGAVHELVARVGGRQYRVVPPRIQDPIAFLETYLTLDKEGVVRPASRLSTDGDWVWRVTETLPSPVIINTPAHLPSTLPVVVATPAWRGEWTVTEGHAFVRTADTEGGPLEIVVDGPVAEVFGVRTRGERLVECVVWERGEEAYRVHNYYCVLVRAGLQGMGEEVVVGNEWEVYAAVRVPGEVTVALRGVESIVY